MRALERELPQQIRREIPPRFAGLVRDTRHYFTHWNAKYEAKAANGDDLRAVVYGLLIVLEVLLLRELGFTKPEIWRIAEGNLRVSQRIRMSFGAL